MYIGQLFQRVGTGAPVTMTSPTFPRGGLSATFAIDVYALSGTSPTLECSVEHKNVEDTSFANADSFASMTSTGVKTLDVSGLKEQIRLTYTVGGSVATNTVYANVLAPQWRPY